MISVPRHFTTRPRAALLTLATAAVTVTLPAPANAKVDWVKEVLPFIERSCVECHKAPYEEGGKMKEPKAELRFDAAWGILKGGENGPVLVPGDPEKSEMYFRVTLPDDDSDFMPSKGEPLTEKEKEVLKQWIAEGGDFGEWIGSLEGKPADTKEKEKKAFVPPPSVYDTLGKGVKPVPAEALSDLAASGVLVTTLQKDNPLLRVDFFNTRDATGDDALAALKPIRTNVAQLLLAETVVTDAGLAQLAGMDHLVRLDLRRTGITDKALDHLTKLANLRHLNLYGTKVTDAGLAKLAQIKDLETVYLWQTKVTEKGVKQLQGKLPKLEINWR